ncbi:hypothetical protein ACLOJK_039108 [Asimina triloba]
MVVALSCEEALQEGIEVSPAKGPKVVVIEADDDNMLEVEDSLPLKAVIPMAKGLLRLKAALEASKSLVEVGHSEATFAKDPTATSAKTGEEMRSQAFTPKGDLSTTIRYKSSGAEVLEDLLSVESRAIRENAVLGLEPMFLDFNINLHRLLDSKGLSLYNSRWQRSPSRLQGIVNPLALTPFKENVLCVEPFNVARFEEGQECLESNLLSFLRCLQNV